MLKINIRHIENIHRPRENDEWLMERFFSFHTCFKAENQDQN